MIKTTEQKAKDEAYFATYDKDIMFNEMDSNVIQHLILVFVIGVIIWIILYLTTLIVAEYFE
jgi:hypothetical protein